MVPINPLEWIRGGTSDIATRGVEWGKKIANRFRCRSYLENLQGFFLHLCSSIVARWLLGSERGRHKRGDGVP